MILDKISNRILTESAVIKSNFISKKPLLLIAAPYYRNYENVIGITIGTFSSVVHAQNFYIKPPHRRAFTIFISIILIAKTSTTGYHYDIFYLIAERKKLVLRPSLHNRLL